MSMGMILEQVLHNLFEGAELPKKYFRPLHLVPRGADRDAWEFLAGVRENVVAHVQSGKNIVITSPEVGNGKTSWAIRLLQRYLAETAFDGRIADRGLFVVCARLWQELSDFNFINTPDFQRRVDKLKNCDLLVIDELGGGSLTKTAYPYFYDIINYRVDNGKSIICTTNYSDEQITQTIGQRCYSRLYDTATVLEFGAKNVRGYDLEEIARMER